MASNNLYQYSIPGSGIPGYTSEDRPGVVQVDYVGGKLVPMAANSKGNTLTHDITAIIRDIPTTIGNVRRVLPATYASFAEASDVLRTIQANPNYKALVGKRLDLSRVDDANRIAIHFYV